MASQVVRRQGHGRHPVWIAAVSEDRGSHPRSPLPTEQCLSSSLSTMSIATAFEFAFYSRQDYVPAIAVRYDEHPSQWTEEPFRAPTTAPDGRIELIWPVSILL